MLCAVSAGISFNVLNTELVVVFSLVKRKKLKLRKVSDLLRVTPLASLETVTKI